jgi:hypothetical protein
MTAEWAPRPYLHDHIVYKELGDRHAKLDFLR